jgi:hypothetical protein
LVSHTHGRERREERKIEKRELQAAVKHGKKEAANPGRDGSKRFKYTHKGVVYITDETSKHEITSWRLDDDANVVQHAQLEPCEYMTHTVLVVDHSGSMRKNDVAPFETRTAAVYAAVTDQFIAPALESQRAQLSAVASSTTDDKHDRKPQVVSLIEMSAKATVVLNRAPLDDALLVALRKRKNSRATSHGNYVPALQAVRNLLEEDITHQVLTTDPRACSLFAIHSIITALSTALSGVSRRDFPLRRRPQRPQRTRVHAQRQGPVV